MYRKVLLLSLIGSAGVLSLLASSLPPPYLEVYTQNDFEGAPFYAYESDRQVFACKNETVRLAWRYLDGKTRLSVEPPQALEPDLDRLALRSDGEREARVVQSAQLGLDDTNGSPDEMGVELLEPEYCTSYDFPLVGWYETTLQQSEPGESVLARQLRLRYFDEREDRPEGLYLTLSESVGYYSDFDESTLCTLNSLEDTLSCSGDTLSLDATITVNGLGGSYSGEQEVTGAIIDYSGTFSAVKQSGAPPVPEYEQW